jgi:predicted RNA binding protein YcfA (HicA-like mRNA interferase family)
LSEKLPVVNAGKMTKLLKRLGYVQKPCTGGSHVNYARADGKGLIITVPHPKSRELRKGTLKQMIRFLSINEGIPEEEIIAILREL